MSNFTSEKIEFLLAKEMYKPVKRMDKRELNQTQKKELNSVEQMTSFGQDIIDLFATMLKELGTLPTQKQYTDKGMSIMLNFIRKHRPDITITPTVRGACNLRLTRTYMSKVTELHLECLLAEKFPDLTIKTFPLLDSVMGVDFIVEDEEKRYYLHVTSNTSFAMDMLRQKENRGGHRVGRTYVEYSRDFSGDIILKYDIHTETDSTMIVNEFPLFKPEYIQFRLGLAKASNANGELLTIPYSKLDHFKDWVRTHLQLEIDSL